MFCREAHFQLDCVKLLFQSDKRSTKFTQKKHLLLDYLWIFIIPDKICVCTQAVQSYVPITKLNCGHFYLYEEHLSDCCPHWFSAMLLKRISSLKSHHHVSTFLIILSAWTSWKRHHFPPLFFSKRITVLFHSHPRRSNTVILSYVTGFSEILCPLASLLCQQLKQY